MAKSVQTQIRTQRLEAKLIIIDAKIARLTAGKQLVERQLEKLRAEKA